MNSTKMHSITNFTVHLIKISIVILLLNSIFSLLIVSCTSNDHLKLTLNSISKDKKSYSTKETKFYSSKDQKDDKFSFIDIKLSNNTTNKTQQINSISSIDTESDLYEFIKLNSTSNSTDAKKSDLHLLHRLYDRLHELHNRHHHHHSHRESFSSSLFGNRPFNRLFRGRRQMDRPMNHHSTESYDHHRHSEFDRPNGFNRPLNRRFGGRVARGWRSKRYIDDSSINSYLEHINHKKIIDNQLTTQSSLNSIHFNYSFNSSKSPYKNSPWSFMVISKPIQYTPNNSQNKSFHSSFSLKSPYLASTKSSLSTSTTPTSISLTTLSFDNFQNYYYNNNSINHHYYHQAYLLYKYFKIYKDKSFYEINWFSLPDEIRDKFRMFFLTLRNSNQKRTNQQNNQQSNDLNNLSDEFLISKALEIVKWNGWKESRIPKRRDSINKTGDSKLIEEIINLKPNKSISRPNENSNQHLSKKSFYESLSKEPKNEDKITIDNKPIKKVIKELTPQSLNSNKQWLINQANVLDQIDDIDSPYYTNTPQSSDINSNTYTPNSYSSNSNSSNSYSSDLYSSNTLSSQTYSSLIDENTSLTATTIQNTKTLTTTMSSIEALRKAFENIEDIKMNHSCNKPRGRLFKLEEIYSNHQYLIPKFVYLHICDDQSGCCTGDKQHCVFKEQEIIIKYFYSLKSNKKQNKVVKLSFVNHTRCECRELDDPVKESINKLNSIKLINNNLINSMKNKLLDNRLSSNKITTKMDINDNSVYNSFKSNDDQFKSIKQNTKDQFDKSNMITNNQNGYSKSFFYNPFNQFNPQTVNHSNQPYQLNDINKQLYSNQKLINSNKYDSLSNAIQNDEIQYSNNINQSIKSNSIDNSISFSNKKFNNKLNIKHFFKCDTNLVCPEPFRITQDRDRYNLCYCGCKSKNVNCLKVMNGLRKLEDYQMSCITNGECLHPECQFKTDEIDYNKKTGYCPTKEDISIKL